MEELSDCTLLFVDDEPGILDILKRIFKGTVNKIQTATSGAEALQFARSNKIDLAVLDLKMPGMDGLTLYEELKKIQPGAGCIFLTAFGDKESVQKALRLGVDNFIDKPFHPEFLKVAVIGALEKKKYSSLMREILELFIFHYTALDLSNFEQLSFAEKERTVRAALGVAKLQILKSKG